MLLAVKVRTLLPVVGFELNDAVTPLGRPEAVRLTLPLNPFIPATVIAEVPSEPCITVNEEGEAPSVKLGATRMPVPLSEIPCDVYSGTAAFKLLSVRVSAPPRAPVVAGTKLMGN